MVANFSLHLHTWPIHLNILRSDVVLVGYNALHIKLFKYSVHNNKDIQIIRWQTINDICMEYFVYYKRWSSMKHNPTGLTRFKEHTVFAAVISPNGARPLQFKLLVTFSFFIVTLSDHELLHFQLYEWCCTMSLKLDIITYFSSTMRKKQMNYTLDFWSTVKTTSWFQLVRPGTSHEYNCVSSFPLDSRWLFVVHSWQHKSITYRNICHYGPR